MPSGLVPVSGAGAARIVSKTCQLCHPVFSWRFADEPHLPSGFQSRPWGNAGCFGGHPESRRKRGQRRTGAAIAGAPAGGGIGRHTGQRIGIRSVHGHHDRELRQHHQHQQLLQRDQRPHAEHRCGCIAAYAADRRWRQRSNADRRQRDGQQQWHDRSELDRPRLARPVIGNASANNSAIVVNNNASGQIKGVVNIATLLGFGGQALVAQNVNGTTTINNAGLISTSLIGAGSVSDATTVVTYGGAAAAVTNTGTIDGRVGLGLLAVTRSSMRGGQWQRSPGDSTGGNTFTAVSGSSVVSGGGTALAGVITGVTGVKVAAAGSVDAGTGSGAANNTLVLQNVVSGPGSGTGGAVTTLGWNQYLNFQKLTVNSGTGTCRVRGRVRVRPRSMMARSISTMPVPSAPGCSPPTAVPSPPPRPV